MPALSEEDLLALLSALPTPPPPPRAPRTPVSVLYGGAQRFSRSTPAKLGSLARAFQARWVPDPGSLAAAVGLDEVKVDTGRVFELLVRKLEHEPVEDLRIDFEDGLGALSDDEEDELATHTGAELAAAAGEDGFPPFVGLRIRSLAEPSRRRALRTLDLFLSSLAASRPLEDLRVTLPKVEDAREVATLVRALDLLEERLGLRGIRVEVMVESPTGLLDRGALRVPSLVEAGGGRVDSIHFGTYDFTGALGVTAAHQRADHPACQVARLLLQLGLAGTGVRLSDGATHRLPLVVHRGEQLSRTQEEQNRRAVERGLLLHADAIRAGLESGIYQGWDLHPSQLIARYAVVFAFFREGLDGLTQRLRGFVERGQVGATTAADWDDAASARGLLNHFRRGYRCGALDEDDLAAAGLSVQALDGEEG